MINIVVHTVEPHFLLPSRMGLSKNDFNREVTLLTGLTSYSVSLSEIIWD